MIHAIALIGLVFLCIFIYVMLGVVFVILWMYVDPHASFNDNDGWDRFNKVFFTIIWPCAILAIVFYWLIIKPITLVFDAMDGRSVKSKTAKGKYRVS